MGRENNQIKPHYDISLSKRTRKPLNLQEEAQKSRLPEEETPVEVVKKEEEKSDHHQSLKQLIKGRSTSLEKHFTEEEEEKQLQLVVKHNSSNEEGSDGVKLKRMVSRYSRILSRLIKAKREPGVGSRNKPALRLTM